MGLATPEFPNYDGLSRDRDSLLQDAFPSAEDWDQLVSEFLEIQKGFDQAIITSLTDNTGGTVDGTLETVDATSLGTIKASADNNFKELNVKLDLILVALRNAKMIKP